MEILRFIVETSLYQVGLIMVLLGFTVIMTLAAVMILAACESLVPVIEETFNLRK